jgi:hypothetical protein
MDASAVAILIEAHLSDTMRIPLGRYICQDSYSGPLARLPGLKNECEVRLSLMHRVPDRANLSLAMMFGTENGAKMAKGPLRFRAQNSIPILNAQPQSCLATLLNTLPSFISVHHTLITPHLNRPTLVLTAT